MPKKTLVFDATQVEVKEGDKIVDIDGQVFFLRRALQPTEHGHVGYALVSKTMEEDEFLWERYYVTVFGLKWVEVK